METRATCNMNVTVVDDEQPEIVCPADITIGTDNGVCETNVTIPAITADDECGIATIVNSYNGTNNASDIYPIGTTIVTWTVTDIHGNISQCDMTITVEDDENPIINSCVPDQTVSANNNCEFTMLDYTGLAVVSDNCDNNLTVTQNPIPGSTVAGTSSVTITVTDDAGNASTCIFDVIVVDTTDPIITVCAPDTVEQVNGACNFTLPSYTSLVTASDNCDASLTFTQSPVPGTVVSGHATVIPMTITVTDDAANFTTCTFNITLNDSINPNIICPANLTVNTDPGLCTAAVNITAPVVNDNCSVVSVINDYQQLSERY
jgi:hypothetical protein